MGRRPSIVYKLECINKFNVVVLINLENNFENNFFLKSYLSSLFMRTPFLATLSILLTFLYPLMSTIFGKSYSLLTEGWVDSMVS